MPDYRERVYFGGRFYFFYDIMRIFYEADCDA